MFAPLREKRGFAKSSRGDDKGNGPCGRLIKSMNEVPSWDMDDLLTRQIESSVKNAVQADLG